MKLHVTKENKSCGGGLFLRFNLACQLQKLEVLDIWRKVSNE